MRSDPLSVSTQRSAIGRAREALDMLERVPTALFQTLFRLAVAAVFFKSGLTKIANWDITVQLFANEYHLPVLPPELAAYLGTTAELTCPVLLVAGLATRLATVPLMGMTLVIQLLVYPENWSEHLTWFGMLFFIFTRGPGPLAL